MDVQWDLDVDGLGVNGGGSRVLVPGALLFGAKRAVPVIAYDLIVASASRPHLLGPTLQTYFRHADQPPARVIIHDDAVFPDQGDAVRQCIARDVPSRIPVTLICDDPPVRHGPALARLLAETQAKYVVYSQDDFRTLRPLPVAEALALLRICRLNQIRFNKRDTGAVKGEPGDPAAFHKLERWYVVDIDAVTDGLAPYPFKTMLTTADHWYFQTGVWRVAAIKPVVDWWNASGPGNFREHCEAKINMAFNGAYRGQHPPWPPDVPELDPLAGAWNDPVIRADVHRTYIWGPIGEKQFIEHIGGDPADWAHERTNRQR